MRRARNSCWGCEMSGIGLSTEIFDLDGALYIDERQIDRGVAVKNKERSRRVSRTATLDGGVAVYDSGYSDGDRTINVNVPRAPAAVIEFMEYIIETYATILLTCQEGAYRAVPNRFTVGDDGSANLELLITVNVGEE